jgi:hypothetical protein
MMIIGGIVELIYGIKAEGRGLESIAQPLTAEDSPGSTGGSGAVATA